MSKPSSGLFHGTLGDLAPLGEDYYYRYLRDGSKVVDVKNLPGSAGMEIPGRLSDKQMMYLTETYGVEFAQVYELGPGKNGGRGNYKIFSGTRNSVLVPVSQNTILINHTHPGGTAHPSQKDRKLMSLLKQAGSPQRVSSILPAGKEPVKFTSEGLR